MASMSGGDESVYLEKKGGRQDISFKRLQIVVGTFKNVYILLVVMLFHAQARDSPTVQEVPDGQVTALQSLQFPCEIEIVCCGNKDPEESLVCLL